jgi:hypothetical protein
MNDKIFKRYPRLIRSMQWVAILSVPEAVSCIENWKNGFDFSGEAVNHYGGNKKVLYMAFHLRHLVPNINKYSKPATN